MKILPMFNIGIYISYISNFVKFNKQLNWKLECVKYFKIKEASKTEVYLMKKFEFKNDSFYTVIDKRADSIDVVNFNFELQLIQ